MYVDSRLLFTGVSTQDRPINSPHLKRTVRNMVEEEDDDETGLEEEKTRRRNKLRKHREKQENRDEEQAGRKEGRLKPFDPSSRRISWKDLIDGE